MSNPDVCHEPNCHCINSTCYHPDILREGFSFFCFGRIPDKERVRFQCADADHRNEYNFCVWTPMKGWVKFLVNDNDMLLMSLIIKSWKKIRDL